jgi:hypothetical protein
MARQQTIIRSPPYRIYSNESSPQKPQWKIQQTARVTIHRANDKSIAIIGDRWHLRSVETYLRARNDKEPTKEQS